MTNRLAVGDAANMVLLFLSTALFAVVFVDFSIAPYEDAAILMRYAEHFAQGHGIVWNIGEKPVDGATDFLFMLLLGLLSKAGMSLEFAARFIGFLSHIASLCIVYITSRSLFNARRSIVFMAALYLAVGPGLYYVAAYFGTPFFALSACVAWYAALNIGVNGETRGRSILFAVAALTTALIRPEGVILTGLMLLGLIYLKGVKDSRKTIFWYAGLFIFIGGAYFLWRWSYFGHPLPNPFYKKGGGSIYPASLKSSILNTVKLCLPALPAFILGFYSRRTQRLTVAFAIPIAGFASAFILLSDEMNYGSRFQYVLLPMILMCWWPLVGAIMDDLRFPGWGGLDTRKKMTVLLLAASIAAGLMGYQYKTGRVGYHRDGRYDAARILSDYRDKGFTMAVTEAGLLPLYSGWRTLDAWGLNDPWIAHNGVVTEEYIGTWRPHVIVFHAKGSPLVPFQDDRAWLDMVMTLKRYAEKNGYVLAAAFGDSPHDNHYYYARTDFKESREIIDRLRFMGYYWFETGRKALNYAPPS